MKQKKLAILSLLCILLMGCRDAAPADTLPPEQLDAYQQMALYEAKLEDIGLTALFA